MDDLEQKIAKLPGWARGYIRLLRESAEPNNSEIRDLRNRLNGVETSYRRIKGRADGMEAILTCAARGGHETAQAYVDRVMSEFAQCEGEESEQG